MTARELIDILDEEEVICTIGLLTKPVKGIEIDSRKVESDVVFVAMRGLRSDGHDYIDDVIYQGCSVVICEYLPELLPGITYIQLRDVRGSLGKLAHHVYGHPSKFLKVIGVTGTNGKSTVVTLLYQLFTGMGIKSGLISTVENRIGDDISPSTHTTPDVITLTKMLRDMWLAGCKMAFMEVSSHGLHQGRVAGIDFSGGVFTNITHDHLDYHGTMLEYIRAKKLLFDGLDTSAFAIINLDDKNGQVMVQNCKAQVKSYALRSFADTRVKVLHDSIQGLHLKVQNQEIYCRLSGEFNAYNLGAAYTTALCLGYDDTQILPVLSAITGAEGRMTKVFGNNTSVVGIVDYAHTPDAVQNVLSTLRNSVRKGQRIITVVGCGGDRDKTKRPIMAHMAAVLSDQVILTSDNPRTENPEIILDEMEAGLNNEQRSKILRITDRKAAIRTAVTLSNEGDVILVAGKGHETYQEINGVKHPFEDKKVLHEALIDIKG